MKSTFQKYSRNILILALLMGITFTMFGATFSANRSSSLTLAQKQVLKNENTEKNLFSAFATAEVKDADEDETENEEATFVPVFISSVYFISSELHTTVEMAKPGSWLPAGASVLDQTRCFRI